jgi:hypothetical protein
MGGNDCFMNDLSLREQERTRYYSHQLISADDLTQDQIYQREKRRMHNRLLHGWGIVCGLDVSLDTTNAASPLAAISPGYALSPQGDEIYVPTEVRFDLGQCITGPTSGACSSLCYTPATNAVDPSQTFYLAIRFIECPARPVRVAPLNCGCDDTACEYSRIRESFEVTCLSTLPVYESENPSTPCDAFTSKVVPCPPIESIPWVVLAAINIVGSNVDKEIAERRMLFNTRAMQNYVISECG